MEIIKPEEHKVKIMKKKSEQRVRNLWHIIKIVGAPEGEEKGVERVFEKIMAENFPNLMKHININI